MKIAILGPLDLEFMGGGETNSMMIGNMLCKAGHEVTYFGTGCPLVNVPIEKVYPKIRFNYIPSAFSKDPMAHPLIVKVTSLLSLGLVGIFSFSKILNRTNEFDVFYFSIPNLMARRLTPLLLKEGKKVILANHGTFFEYFGNSRNPLFRLFEKMGEMILIQPLSKDQNGLLVHTQTSFQTSVYRSLGFSRSNIVEIPQNNVDFRDYKVSNNSGTFTVVFLGRMVKSKGIRLLSQIIQKNQNIKFHVIGNGPLLKQFMTNAPYPNAEIYGYISDEQKRQILSSSDLMVVPSEFDSLSISAIEGLASGLPIVASDCAQGPKYILGANKCLGQLTKRTVGAFSECIQAYKQEKESDHIQYLENKFQRRDVAKALFDMSMLESFLDTAFANFINNSSRPKPQEEYFVITNIED